MAENSTRNVDFTTPLFDSLLSAGSCDTAYDGEADYDSVTEDSARPSRLSIAVIRQFARAYRVERRMPSIFSGLLLN